MASGPRTDSTGQIVKRNQGNEEPKIVTLLGKMKGEIARALPRHVTVDRMMRVALTALRTNEDLLECSTVSVLGSIMSSAQLGLEPNTPLGLAYLIPYKKVCQLIIGYQGYMELARRSGFVSMPTATIVRQGDFFKVTYGLHPDIKHDPAEDDAREDRPWTHVYAVANVIPEDSAPPIFVVLTRAQVLKRKARSASANSSYSPWKTDEEAMVLKTAIRALWKWLPKTAEMATASSFDSNADRGSAQVEHWDQGVVDALKREGLVVDAPDVTPEPEAEPTPETPAPAGEDPAKWANAPKPKDEPEDRPGIK